jgi:hypothetical protein
MKKFLDLLVLATLAVTIFWQPALAAPSREDSAWYAEYFNNTALSGSPAVTRYDNAIRFEWSTRAPATGVSADNFSVRWTRTVRLDWSGNYRFYISSDDGIRVWVDDLLIIDQWHDRQDAWTMTDIILSGGEHRLKVEYYEHEGAATAKVIYQPEATKLWYAEYFTNVDLDGSPGKVDYLETLDVDWGGGSPGEWFHRNWFSARFTRDVFMTSGTYRFDLTTQGGVRLWVDGGLVIDQWHETDKTTHSGTTSVSAGSHQIKVEYYETYHDASLRLVWQPAQPPPPKITGWRGEYYATADLSGGAIMVRDDKAIDLNWSDTAPGVGLPSDFFSVRWTRSAYFSPAGYYRFSVLVDDGIRMWIDDQLVLDEWHRSDSQSYLVDRQLAAGTHTIKVEYYEHTGFARIRLDWQRTNTSSTQALIDDTDAGFVRGGDESGWTLVYSGYGRRSWRASNRAGWWARWTPPLPCLGRYEVFAYVPYVSNATQKALYYVKHEGDVTTITVDQRKNAGRWVSLGTYGFNANGTEFVHLDGVTEEAAGSRNIGFDALKWVWRGN